MRGTVVHGPEDTASRAIWFLRHDVLQEPAERNDSGSRIHHALERLRRIFESPTAARGVYGSRAADTIGALV